jgi:hypothetical protein
MPTPLGYQQLPAPLKNSVGGVAMATIDINSSAVQKYLEFLQSVINRMASNSNGCKTWCVTLVSAIIVIIADKAKPNYVWIAIAPIVLFLFLDSYYLSLERSFRALYNAFVGKLHANTATDTDVYKLTPNYRFSSTIGAFKSLSVWPFYGLLAAMLIITRVWLL